ncbi:CPBP family intramembrane glutamic endopeptidase [Rhodococcus erythropolis]|uniref:CPBP family intramembrane glutamic endopeptidase n=1 Tax=Rhodococcus erythropolis TaxID=1833 RepID=UPI001BE90B27|nr:CPBP family intramembrane glutamic endopeptidase [Rhodococcus erythropolis]MBT2266707.1 CPBP family intramembrane metalloprotease [Rhodococcus erythropolis]
MTNTVPEKSGFWSRPTVWKVLLLIVGYLAFYLAVGQVTSRVFANQIDTDNVVASASSIIFGVAVPIAIGGIALLIFATTVGWLRDIFGPQPIRGRGWMWIGPIIVVAAIVAHLAGTDWSAWTTGEIIALLVLGACVGLTEELAIRGLAVKMLRDAGHRERFVAVVSSLAFALMHTVNLIAGMKPSTVLATVVYTFGFGMCMYLTMRVTGTIWAAIVLHGLTDPTTILSTGGLDTSVTTEVSGAAAITSLLTVLLVVFGVIAVFLIRDRIGEERPTPVSA